MSKIAMMADIRDAFEELAAKVRALDRAITQCEGRKIKDTAALLRKLLPGTVTVYHVCQMDASTWVREACPDAYGGAYDWHRTEAPAEGLPYWEVHWEWSYAGNTYHGKHRSYKRKELIRYAEEVHEHAQKVRDEITERGAAQGLSGERPWLWQE